MSPTQRVKPRSAKITAKTGKSIAQTEAGGGRIVYANRELSWLAFNRRVLEQAESEANPLLERTKFLAIVSSNLDEFFEIRIAGLLQQKDSAAGEPSIDGLSPREQLKRAFNEIKNLVKAQYLCWHEQLVPALAKEKITFKTAEQLTAAERVWVQDYFAQQVHPVLTPLAIDQSHPFPEIGNKTLNVIVALDNPEAPEPESHTAVLPVPRILPRLVQLLPDRTATQTFIFLSEIIKLCAGELFPGYRVNSAHAFRVTRNSDLYIDDEEAENLLKKIEEELRNLRRGAAVRLEIEAGVPDAVFNLLCEHLRMSPEYVFKLDGPLNLVRMMSLADLVDRPDLKYPIFTPVEVPQLRVATSIFSAIQEHDILLQHPYESFQPVVDFVQQAARDPSVLAIKQTLYRTSGDSPIIGALIEASQNGKQVTALIELKARFDEANNIKWARELEEAGVHVVFGLVGHKTHCKCSMVVRQEADGLRSYAHLGTGNYHVMAARLYTDLGLFTCRPDLTEDLAELFNYLTGRSLKRDYKKLIVAPFHMKERFLALIERETAHRRAGRPAYLVAKMNSLEDREICAALYRASQAGVSIDLLVRGFCCLKPGVPGMSERIRVRSIVGRFLEHSRLFYFRNGSADPLDGEFFLGSADWMYRNLLARVEAVAPIEARALKERCWELLQILLRDQRQAWELQPDGSYTQCQPSAEAEAAQAPEALGAHQVLMNLARKTGQPGA